MKSEKIKELIDRIPDKKLRAKQALEFLRKNSEHNKIGPVYAKEHIEEFELTDVKYSFWDSEALDMLKKSLRLIPENEREKYVSIIQSKVLESAKDFPIQAKKTVEKLELFQDDSSGLEQILLAGSFMQNSNPKMEINDEVIDYVAQLIKSNPEITKSVDISNNLFQNESFIQKYSSDSIFRDIAIQAIFEESTQYNSNMKKIETLIKNFGLSQNDIDSPQLVNDILKKGRTERADIISGLLGYKINRSEIRNVTNYLRQQLDEMIKAGDIETVVETHQQINTLIDYKKNGLNIDRVPEVQIYSNGGKMILVEYKDKIFLRGAKPQERFHKDISGSFENDLELAGFEINDEQYEVLGGAYFGIGNNNTRMSIYDSSVDYGECDKYLAKEKMQKFLMEK